MELKRIYLALFPEVEEEVGSFLEKNLSQIFNLPLELKRAGNIPPEAYNPQRDQYNASYLLRVLPMYSQSKTLGVTGVDLYAPGLNFVFGQAEVGGSRAIISLARLNPRFFGEPFSEEIFLLRALKEAVHELGHTFGLGHCSNSKCVMFFSNTLSDTDKKDYKFCPRCQKMVFTTCNFDGDE